MAEIFAMVMGSANDRPPKQEFHQVNQHRINVPQFNKYHAPLSLSKTDVNRLLSTIQQLQPSSSSDNCVICWEPLSNETCSKINDCGHIFHQKCIHDCLTREPKCPICRQPMGEPQGYCPSGTMTICLSDQECPGYGGAKAIQIEYDLPRGVQASYHENTGQSHSPTYRVAFIPDTDEGCRLLTRLKYAWTCGLLFTIGTSLTTGQPNAIVWSSVHHKTSLWGGPYSFPDPNYFYNCNESLDALSVPDPDTCLRRLVNTPRTSTTEIDQIEEFMYDAPACLSSSHALAGAIIPVKIDSGDCAICFESLSQTSVAIRACNHIFHRKCLKDCLNRKLLCPVCRSHVGEPQGLSPSGKMKINTIKNKACPGFGCTEILRIEYMIPPGIQQSYHPNPGMRYQGTVRTAYLPKNNEGTRLLKRLKFAWKNGLTFKIGTSLTTGKHNSVVWTGIHHKTSMRGGEHGFPDNSYIDKCNNALDDVRVPCADSC